MHPDSGLLRPRVYPSHKDDHPIALQAQSLCREKRDVQPKFPFNQSRALKKLTSTALANSLPFL
jgi:hypothetical protein